MSYDIAKRNRLNGKFNFKLRDWQFELDGLEDPPPRVPLKNGRPRSPEVNWQRAKVNERDQILEESSAG